MKTFKTHYKSPIGTVEIEGPQDSILNLNFVDQAHSDDDDLPSCIKECAKQIDEYFQGNRKTFSLNLIMQGTDFQKSVWRQLRKIPYGTTASYGEVAVAIGNPTACRAVGSANGKNPISIIVPCHRVIGSDGTLTGYGGGLWRKEWLLKHEKDNR
ncbi:MAG: methylated-DNA--[protein]-cysteine S-methyltransferase [Desulfobacterales bacterium]|nr:MAG: methylated-DNA--[protein]-cysteine S-methyltransferase [Desulfobacterales bacterium]